MSFLSLFKISSLPLLPVIRRHCQYFECSAYMGFKPKMIFWAMNTQPFQWRMQIIVWNEENWLIQFEIFVNFDYFRYRRRNKMSPFVLNLNSTLSMVLNDMISKEIVIPFLDLEDDGFELKCKFYAILFQFNEYDVNEKSNLMSKDTHLEFLKLFRSKWFTNRCDRKLESTANLLGVNHRATNST